MLCIFYTYIYIYTYPSYQLYYKEKLIHALCHLALVTFQVCFNYFLIVKSMRLVNIVLSVMERYKVGDVQFYDTLPRSFHSRLVLYFILLHFRA